MTLSPTHAIDNPIDTSVSNCRFHSVNLPNASLRSQLAFRQGRPFHRTKYSHIGETSCLLVTYSARIVSTSFSHKLPAYCWYPSFLSLECHPFFMPTNFSLPLRIRSPCGLATSACSPALLPCELALDMKHLHRT